MGWTWYNATHYKKGNVDRKAECDEQLNWETENRKNRVLKSAMVGSTYYGAVESTLNSGERTVFGVVFLTSTNNRDYYNFGYKDMDETMHPYYYDCPNSILELLTETDNENARTWREKCREQNAKKKQERKSGDSLNNLPVGSKIKFKCDKNLTSGHSFGDEVVLEKRVCGFNYKTNKTKTIWTDGYYRWSKKLINNEYEIIRRGNEDIA